MKERTLRMAAPESKRVAFVQADANRYHYACACAVYGKARIILARTVCELYTVADIAYTPILRTLCPKGQDGELLTVHFQEQWREEKAQARLHGEPVYDSCGHCLKRIR